MLLALAMPSAHPISSSAWMRKLKVQNCFTCAMGHDVLVAVGWIPTHKIFLACDSP